MPSPRLRQVISLFDEHVGRAHQRERASGTLSDPSGEEDAEAHERPCRITAFPATHGG